MRGAYDIRLMCSISAKYSNGDPPCRVIVTWTSAVSDDKSAKAMEAAIMYIYCAVRLQTHSEISHCLHCSPEIHGCDQPPASCHPSQPLELRVERKTSRPQSSKVPLTSLAVYVFACSALVLFMAASNVPDTAVAKLASDMITDLIGQDVFRPV